jgi:hypothetical protein
MRVREVVTCLEIQAPPENAPSGSTILHTKSSRSGKELTRIPKTLLHLLGVFLVLGDLTMTGGPSTSEGGDAVPYIVIMLI